MLLPRWDCQECRCDGPTRTLAKFAEQRILDNRCGSSIDYFFAEIPANTECYSQNTKRHYRIGGLNLTSWLARPQGEQPENSSYLLLLNWESLIIGYPAIPNDADVTLFMKRFKTMQLLTHSGDAARSNIPNMKPLAEKLGNEIEKCIDPMAVFIGINWLSKTWRVASYSPCILFYWVLCT